MSELQVLDQTGDTRLLWNMKNADEVAAARKKFDEFKAKGYLSYKVNRKGTEGEIINDFDPEEERIILSPPPIGG